MKEEILRFKIIGFTKFDNGDDNDCVAVLENGKEIIVDPFVGCAYEYEQREHLLNEWWEATGFFHRDGAFLPREKYFKKLNNITN